MHRTDHPLHPRHQVPHPRLAASPVPGQQTGMAEVAEGAVGVGTNSFAIIAAADHDRALWCRKSLVAMLGPGPT